MEFIQTTWNSKFYEKLTIFFIFRENLHFLNVEIILQDIVYHTPSNKLQL